MKAQPSTIFWSLCSSCVYAVHINLNAADTVMHLFAYVSIEANSKCSTQVFNRVGSGMLSFQYIFLSTNIICPIVVSYFPVSVLASMHACAVGS